MIRLSRFPISPALLFCVVIASRATSLCAGEPSATVPAVPAEARAAETPPSELQSLPLTIWRKEGDRARVDLNAWLSADRFAPGSSCEVLIELQIQSGWHLHAAYLDEEQSGPFRTGWPYTRIQLRGPEGWTFDAIKYPPGSPVTQFGQQELPPAYRDRTRISGMITAPEKPAAEPPKLEFEIFYQATNDRLCELPTSVRVSVPVGMAASGTDVQVINAELFRNPQPVDIK